MDPQTWDVLVKVVLTLLGAASGAAFKAFVDSRRVHSLLPIVLEQVDKAAAICQTAFSVEEAAIAGSLCEAGFQGLSELVALGVRPQEEWRKGVKLLLETSIRIRRVGSAKGGGAVSALESLREEARALGEWLITVRPAGRSSVE